MENKRHGLLLGILIAARFAAGLVLFPQWMFAKYPDSARLLTEGRLKPEQGGDFSPFYLLVNVAFAPGTLRVIQAALVAVCIVSAYVIAKRTAGPWAGLGAGFIVALAVPVFLYEATLEPDILATALGVAGIALLGEARADVAKVRTALLAGIVLGVASATRPSALLFWGLAVLMVTWASRAVVVPWKNFRVAALIVGGVIGVAIPALLVRAVVGPELGATMSAGAVLHMGNRPEGTGLGTQPPVLIKLIESQERSVDNPDAAHGIYRRFARLETGTELTPVECEIFWMKKTLNFLKRHPGAYAELLLKKLTFYVVGPDGHDLTEVRRAEDSVKSYPLLPTGLLGALGFASAIFLALKRRAGISLLLLYMGSLMALALGFYVISRYRLAATPIWAVLIAMAVALLVTERKSPKTWIAWGVPLAGLLVLQLVTPFLRDARHILDRALVASSLGADLDKQRSDGQLAEATKTFVAVQAAQPYTILTRDLRGIPFESPRLATESGIQAIEKFGLDERMDAFMAAELGVRAQRCDMAGTSAASLAETGFHWAIFDVSLDPALVAARCKVMSGDRNGALKVIEASLDSSPGRIDELAFLIAGEETLNQTPSTERRDELFSLHDMMSARFALADAFRLWGNLAGATEALRPLRHALPDSGSVWFEQAQVDLLAKREPEALAAYAEAVHRFPFHAFPVAEFDSLMNNVEQEEAPDPRALALVAEHALRRGRIVKARSIEQRMTLREGTKSPSDAQRSAWLGKVTTLPPEP